MSKTCHEKIRNENEFSPGIGDLLDEEVIPPVPPMSSGKHINSGQKALEEEEEEEDMTQLFRNLIIARWSAKSVNVKLYREKSTRHSRASKRLKKKIKDERFPSATYHYYN